MIISWKKDWVSCLDVFKGQCTLSCIFKNCKGDIEWMFTRVYYRGNKAEKLILWDKLENCKTRRGSMWIIGEDFNTTLRRGRGTVTVFGFRGG